MAEIVVKLIFGAPKHSIHTSHNDGSRVIETCMPFQPWLRCSVPCGTANTARDCY